MTERIPIGPQTLYLPKPSKGPDDGTSRIFMGEELIRMQAGETARQEILNDRERMRQDLLRTQTPKGPYEYSYELEQAHQAQQRTNQLQQAYQEHQQKLQQQQQELQQAQQALQQLQQAYQDRYGEHYGGKLSRTQSKGGASQYVKAGKKEILGKNRVIYKKKGSKKEYVKSKGRFIRVSDYKKMKK
jgi:multidrug resistance efflux pump